VPNGFWPLLIHSRVRSLKHDKDQAMTPKDQQDGVKKVPNTIGPDGIAEEVIPIVEERMTVGRRIVKGCTVTVTTRPISEAVRIVEPVMRENIEIERIPVNRVVESAPEVREEGDLTVIPVMEERVTVTVELVLKEEIHLRRTRSNEAHEETVRLNKTQVDISG
jgi:uncharacterized protein (TIGR02271 family)